MLGKLSLKNIQKSFKDYAIYFFTLVLGVAIFYVFNAIDSQTVMMNISSSTREIIKLMTDMLSGISVFISFILGFLIIYASRFLIKRRNKEFGIYLTLGMSKRKISLILFLETLFIGIISLIIGLLLGILLSQFMSLLVVNLFEADMTKFSFVFSLSASLKSIIYFGITYILVMIFNTISISKCKLIDLLHGSKKSEKIKMKNPIICIIVFVTSVIVLGYAYYMVTYGLKDLDLASEIFKPIIMGSISTFLIFWSLSGLILKIAMSIKKYYYKGLNSFTVRQFSSKINTTVFSMSIICLMLFITICVLSSALSIRNSMSYNLEFLTKADVDIESSAEQQEIIPYLAEYNFDYQKYFKNYVTYNNYKVDDLTIKNYLKKYLSQEEFENIRDYPLELMTISDYNNVAKFYNHPTYELNKDEYIIIADYEEAIKMQNIALQNKQVITINNQKFVPKYSECQDGYVNINSNHANIGIFVVPDFALNEQIRNNNGLLANYKETDKLQKKVIDDKLLKINKDILHHEGSTLYLNTRTDILESSIGLGAMVTFIGLYLGIIFLISSSAILALKELSESSDNVLRFKMIRKIGADEKMINKALFRQIAIFFLFPLALAIIHSIFGIMFSNSIIEIFGNEKLLPSIIMTAIFILFIYGGYFLITYYCSKNIIKEH